MAVGCPHFSLDGAEDCHACLRGGRFSRAWAGQSHVRVHADEDAEAFNESCGLCRPTSAAIAAVERWDINGRPFNVSIRANSQHLYTGTCAQSLPALFHSLCGVLLLSAAALALWFAAALRREAREFARDTARQPSMLQPLVVTSRSPYC
eukprot:EG_transcript_26704